MESGRRKRNVRTGQNTGFSVWLLLYGCRGDASYQKADLPEQTDLSLLDYADTATDCTMEKGSEGITVSNLGADPNVVFPGVASCFADNDKLYGLSLTVDAPDETEMAV